MPTNRSTAAKLLRIIEELVGAQGGLGVREAARDTGIDKSAVSRLLTQLVELEAATRDEVTGRFHAGPLLYSLAATLVARDSITRAARPILEDLVSRFNETCYLAVGEDHAFAFRAKVDCDRAVRYVIELGRTAPLHAGAAGRAILLGMSSEELADAIAHVELTPMTTGTITDAEELLRRVESDRERGFALSVGERVSGGSAIAAPFHDAGGRCRGSIVFTRPAQRHQDDDVQEISEAVVGAARLLTARLGGSVATEDRLELPATG